MVQFGGTKFARYHIMSYVDGNSYSSHKFILKQHRRYIIKIFLEEGQCAGSTGE